MVARQRSWSRILRSEGPEFLAWVKEDWILSKKFTALSRSLSILFRGSIQTTADANEVWKAVPDVLGRCNEPSTYELPGAAWAYAWLHLPDRYIRTWMALERLVNIYCLPMGDFGVRALDVGTGPGPSFFAIHDFYNAMTEFSKKRDRPNWQQTAKVACIELSVGINQLRHFLAEILDGQSKSKYGSVFEVSPTIKDFKEFQPTTERRKHFEYLRNQTDEYYDGELSQWTSDTMFLPDEANDKAQTLHRYRLLTLSNFLTPHNTVEWFEPNLIEILQDAAPGTVLLIIGSNIEEYSPVYKSVARLAKPAGFRPRIYGEPIASSQSGILDSVFRTGREIFDHLENLAPNKDMKTWKVRKYFKGSRPFSPISQIWAYRKDLNARAILSQ